MTITLKSILPRTCLMAAAVAALPVASVQAEEGISLSANAALVSDYRFRGISLSDKDIAMQGGFDLSTDSGFYVGTWGSSIDTFAGSETELDIYAGYGGEFGNGLAYDVGLLAYTYPGSSDTYYVEAYSSISGSIEDFGWTLGTAYAWDQDNIGNDNIYIYADGEYAIPDTALALTAHVAVEDGAFGKGPSKKYDWNLGLSYAVSDSISLGLQYVDTNVAGLGSAGAVVTLGASF